MVQARRAKPRPAQVIVPLALAAVLLFGGIFAAWRLWPDATAANPQPTPTVGASESTAAPTGAQPGRTSEASPSAVASSVTTSASAASTAAEKALKDCRAKVRAADAVLKAARTGTDHWIAHVQAETDARSGKIDDDEKKARFAATRVLGPGDQKRYRDALSAYRKLDASCGQVENASDSVTESLAACAARDKAQQPMLKAGAGTMTDWKNHLADMQRSREYHVENAQDIWIATWRAASRNINAYTSASAKFKAPAC